MIITSADYWCNLSRDQSPLILQNLKEERVESSNGYADLALLGSATIALVDRLTCELSKGPALCCTSDSITLQIWSHNLWLPVIVERVLAEQGRVSATNVSDSGPWAWSIVRSSLWQWSERCWKKYCGPHDRSRDVNISAAILTSHLGRPIQRSGQRRSHPDLGQIVLRVRAPEFSPASSWVFFHSSSDCRCCHLDLVRDSTQNSSLDNPRNSRRHNCAGSLFVRELWFRMVLPHLEDPPSSSGVTICRPVRSLPPYSIFSPA